MPQETEWKDRLYGAYVSSGQAGKVEQMRPEEVFRTRAAYLQGFIQRYFPTQRDARVLDLGCGHGAALHFLAQAGYTNLIGVDVSAEQIALAHRMGIHQARQGTLDDVLADEGAGTADVVLAKDVLEHLTRPELLATLDKIHDVLKPGGVCIAHVPNAEGIFGSRVRYGDLTHELAFTPMSAQQAFRAAGFARVECFEDKPAVHGAASMVRWLIWQCGTLPMRLLLAAERGTMNGILSQNMVVRATR